MFEDDGLEEVEEYSNEKQSENYYINCTKEEFDKRAMSDIEEEWLRVFRSEQTQAESMREGEM